MNQHKTHEAEKAEPTKHTEKTVDSETKKAEAQTETKAAAPAEKKTEADKVPETEAAESAQAQVDELNLQLAEIKGKYAYLCADFENFRRRTARDIQTARSEATEKAIAPMIQVLDHFKMAVDASEKSDNVEKLREGLKMIHGELDKVIQQIGLETINAEGTMFDPAVHEAISQMPSDKPEGTVLQQWTCGYKHGDRLIRPAKVIVSSGAPETTDSSDVPPQA